MLDEGFKGSPLAIFLVASACDSFPLFPLLSFLLLQIALDV